MSEVAPGHPCSACRRLLVVLTCADHDGIGIRFPATASACRPPARPPRAWRQPSWQITKTLHLLTYSRTRSTAGASSPSSTLQEPARPRRAVYTSSASICAGAAAAGQEARSGGRDTGSCTGDRRRRRRTAHPALDGRAISTLRRTCTARAGRLLLVVGALLCLAVTYIHLADQGGYAPGEWFPGDTDPQYIKIGYYLLEAAGVLAAVLLFVRSRLGWLLAAGVATGPLVGYLLTRTTGLPDATDIGNWGDTLGTVSLVVEAGLLLLAMTRLRPRPPQPNALTSGAQARAWRADAAKPGAATELSRGGPGRASASTATSLCPPATGQGRYARSG